MSRQNKKEAITALHHHTILLAAEQVFYEKGFSATTIEDLSKASSYSRRTIYTYFQNKEDILYNVILKGLNTLHNHLNDSLTHEDDFLTQYFSICKTLKSYYSNYPYSFDAIYSLTNREMKIDETNPTLIQVLKFEAEINQLMEVFLKKGQDKNIVQSHLNIKQATRILWISLISLITIAHNKDSVVQKELNIPVEQFLQDGYIQIINSVLETRIL